VNAVSWVFAAGWLIILGACMSAVLRRLPGGQPQPKRTAAQVMEQVREARRAYDLATCLSIWPDPPSARVIEAQHHLEKAQQQKEEEQ
jgi:hypothetical protein